MKKPKCKICKIEFERINPLQSVCSPKCAIIQIKRGKENNWQKEKKERKEKLKTRSDYLAELQVLVNRFVRLRDKDKPCISCGTQKQNIKYDAGHFYSVGAYPNLRFNLNNIHKQCSNNCNTHLSGNLLEYRPRLIKRIGQKRFDELERIKNIPLKISVEEIKEQKTIFRKKIKELESK